MTFVAFKDQVQEGAIQDIVIERRRQDEKFPGQVNSGMDYRQWLVILMEEVGEVAKAILEEEDGEYRTELIQVAAVALAAVEDYDDTQLL